MKRRIVSIILMLCLMLPSFSAFAEEGVNIDLINEIINYIEVYYHFDVDREDLINGAYRGIMDALDPHSSYFTQMEFRDFMDSLDGELIGIGVYVEPYENYIRVISPIDGMPAHLAGIKSGDLITHVNDIDVTKHSFENAIDMILGEEGSEVKITVNRNGEIIDFYIIRALISIPDAEHEMLDNQIGYLKIRQFGSSASEEVEASLLDLQSQGMTSLVIDLRNNPGGYLNEVIEIADWFVEVNDPILHVDSRAFLNEDVYGQTDALDIPIVVIINNGTASASEILSGAIQYNEKGTILGTTSYGKGTVQRLIQLSYGGALKLTTAEYLAAGKVPVDGIGIEPDIIIESKTSEQTMIIDNFVDMNGSELMHAGKTGSDVFGAQQRLKFLGYDVEATGYFDPKTFNALIEFQKQKGIERLYALYPETKAALIDAVDLLFQEDPQLDRAIELLQQ